MAPGGSQSWTPDSYSRHLKLFGNRPVRTRMQGGVGAGGGNTPGYPMYARHGRDLIGCKSYVGG